MGDDPLPSELDSKFLASLSTRTKYSKSKDLNDAVMPILGVARGD